MRLKRIKILITLCGLCVLFACSHKGTYPPRQVPVSTVTVHAQKIPLNYSYIGVVEPTKAIEVRAQIGGILKRHNFREGAYVHAGDSLFEIDAQQYEAAILEAQAKIEQAQAIYKEAKFGADRAQKLLASHVFSLSSAQQAFSKMAEAQAALHQAEAALSVAKLNLSYTKVRAPISGIIGRQLISDGSLISAGNSVLANITQLDPVYVNFSFSNSEFAEIKNVIKFSDSSCSKLAVELYNSNAEAYPQKGWVDFTSPNIDENTSTVKARALVNNHVNKLMPGDFVRLKLSGLFEDGIAIPEESLMQDSAGTYVYVVRKFTVSPKAPPMLLAERLNVKVARQLGDRRWLLKAFGQDKAKKSEQLQDGDQVLVKGHFMIQSAMPAIAGKLPGVPVVVTNLDGKALAVK